MYTGCMRIGLDTDYTTILRVIAQPRSLLAPRRQAMGTRKLVLAPFHALPRSQVACIRCDASKLLVLLNHEKSRSGSRQITA